MKAKLLLALLPAVCLCGPAYVVHAQQDPTASPVVTGRIAGVVKDPSGAVVAGAKSKSKAWLPE